jgi:hypothetical protein
LARREKGQASHDAILWRDPMMRSYQIVRAANVPEKAMIIVAFDDPIRQRLAGRMHADRSAWRDFMPKRNSTCIAAAGWLALTGAASAMPLGQPGSRTGVQPGIERTAWQCFQFGNCVWRPDSDFYPPYYGQGYKAPPPRYYRKRYSRN